MCLVAGFAAAGRGRARHPPAEELLGGLRHPRGTLFPVPDIRNSTSEPRISARAAELRACADDRRRTADDELRILSPDARRRKKVHNTPRIQKKRTRALVTGDQRYCDSWAAAAAQRRSRRLHERVRRSPMSPAPIPDAAIDGPGTTAPQHPGLEP